MSAVTREKIRVLGLQAQHAATRGDLTEAARVLDLALAEFDPHRSPNVTRALDRLHLLRAKTAVAAGQTFVLPDRWAIPLAPTPDRTPRSEPRSRPRKSPRADAASVEPQARRNRRGTSPVPKTLRKEPTSHQPRTPARSAPTPIDRSVDDSKTASTRGRRTLHPADLPGLAGRWLGIRPPTKVKSVVSAGAMETDRHRH